MESSDTQQFIADLNADLRLEFQSIVQYVQHVAIDSVRSL